MIQKRRQTFQYLLTRPPSEYSQYVETVDINAPNVMRQGSLSIRPFLSDAIVQAQLPKTDKANSQNQKPSTPSP